MPQDNESCSDDSYTIKLHAPDNICRDAIYFTIVGYPTPTAFFINSKTMESFQWITATMTSWSRQLELAKMAGIEDPMALLIKDMKETFEPNGDYFIPGSSGIKVNSIVHHLGLLLEKRMNM